MPRKNYLLPAGLFFPDSATFCFFSVLQTLSLLFLCKNFLAILRNSSSSWKSLFPVEKNYLFMGTNLSNQLMMSFVWREFSSMRRKMMKEDPGVSKSQAWGCTPCIPFSINNHQFILLHAIFLWIHMLCAMLGASCIYFFSLFSFACCS